MFSPKTSISPTIEYLLAENQMLREEIKVGREASGITAKLVVRQFEETEKMLRKFQSANAERQAVLDAATQLSIIATDLNGEITLFSPGATTLLGYSADEMVGKRNISCLHLDYEIRHHGEKLLGKPNSAFGYMDNSPVAYINSAAISAINLYLIRVFDQYVKQKISQSSDWTYIKKDGSLLPINLSITPFYNAKGSLRGYLFTAMDMSSHKLMERELIDAIKNAESANASKGDFLARMSHEIRTPMNGVLGMAHLMKKTPLSPKQANYLDKILSSANNLLNLINDILDFSKIDAGKLELESIPFDLEDVLSHLVNSIGLNAEQKGLEFVFQIDKRVPFNLVGDPLRLGQVLMNLASNAVKFTEHGEIIVSVSVDDKRIDNIEDDGVTLRFSVRDSGIGLYPDQIESLFDPFIQADDTVTRKYGGTGLGLAICRQLTDMMGGRIWVESTPGKGSDFIFTSRFKLSEEVSARSVSCQDSFKGLHALVVDDNETARNVLRSMLESFKIRVDTANDGSRAIQHLEQAVKNGSPYDIVLLDWIMPGIDGIETARRIRANIDLSKIPAMLMVTANGREEARVEAEQAGIEGFLLKPVYASVMYNTLLEMLHIEPPRLCRKKSRSDYVEAVNAIKGLKGRHILLVEDNAINQEVATSFLQNAGIIVTVASNGVECLDIIDKNRAGEKVNPVGGGQRFDLVLMDIQMPLMDGLEATRRIRNEKLMTDIPIIAMTAHAMAGDREKSMNAGMDGHINKPVDPLELYSVLGQFIGERSDRVSSDSGIAVSDTTTKVSDQSVDTCYPDSSGGYPGRRADTQTTLPFKQIRGIDHETAIKRLNNNPLMLIDILNDFRKGYADEPERIRELFREGNSKDIQMRAHTIKGIAGYMGADAVLLSAGKLEEFLKLNDGLLLAETATLVEALSENIEDILDSLADLPSAATLPCNQRYSSLDPSASILPSSSIPSSSVLESDQTVEQSCSIMVNQENSPKIDISSAFNVLNRFMELLYSGDASATDMLPEIQSILRHHGLSNEVKAIAEFIEEIEYEAAGDIIKTVVTALNVAPNKITLIE